MIRIFVGTDRSQKLAFQVLSHSIRRQAANGVEISALDGSDLPAPPDPEHAPRTGFSFARFAIPQLTNFSGRAIYLDADMLVFRDVAELWSMPLEGAKVACQEELPDTMASSALRPGTRRRKQCSVMVLDCNALNWDVVDIISGLGPRYTYDELLSELCILDEADINHTIPVHWNSLEHFDPETRLLHYTDMMLQPWVFSGNRNGWLWVDELRRMIRSGTLRVSDVEAEIAEGYVRPSLAVELSAFEGGQLTSTSLKRLRQIDMDAYYQPHAALAECNGTVPFSRRLVRKAMRVGAALFSR